MASWKELVVGPTRARGADRGMPARPSLQGRSRAGKAVRLVTSVASGCLLLLGAGAAEVASADPASAATVVATIPVGIEPDAIVADPANHDLYVANENDGTVSVISGDTNAVISTLTVGTTPFALAYDSANRAVYVANLSDGTVSVIDGGSNSVTATVTVGSAPDALLYDPANNYIYVTNADDDTVSVIDGSTNSVVATVSTFGKPESLALDSGNGDVYVGDLSTGRVQAIDGTNNVVATIRVGSEPYALAYDPADNEVLAANIGSNSVSVISDVTNAVTSTVTVGTAPDAILYDPNNEETYVSNIASSNVSIIASGVAGPTVTVGSRPYALALDSDNGSIDVADSGSASGAVSIIDPSTNAVTTVKAGISTEAIAYDGSNGEIYAVNNFSGTVSVVATKANPVVTSSAGSAVTFGSGVALTDTATLSGGSVPTGTLTFTLYDPSGGVAYTDAVAVSGNGTYATSAGDNPGGFVPPGVGTYEWVANYSGDAGNSAAGSALGSDPELVNPAPVTITASSPTMTYGSSVPQISAVYAGLVGGRLPATPPTCSTTATSSSPPGSYPTSCTGAVDADYAFTYAAGSLTVLPALTQGGTFVVGNLSAGGPTVGTSVEFFGGTWSKANALSGGPAPATFKGFEAAPAPLGCGGGWTASPGDSAPAPVSVPTYTLMIVSGTITRSGSVVAGGTLHLVVVKVDPGYSNNPDHADTGTIFSVVC